jgi:hypothetical protein
MTSPGEHAWLDGDAGRLVRPYTVTNGRTTASRKLELLSMVVATGIGVHRDMEPDHVQVLDLCLCPVSVAEIAARVRLPAVIAKVLVSDLADYGAVRAASPASVAHGADRLLLERILDGLQRRL